MLKNMLDFNNYKVKTDLVFKSEVQLAGMVLGLDQIGNISYKTLDPLILLEKCKPFLTVAQTFEWIHCCVAVIPISLFFFTMFLVIYSSTVSNSYAVKIIKKLKQEISPEEIVLLKDDVYLQLTIYNLQKSIRFIKVLLFLELVNPLNWTRYMPIFGGFFLSTPTNSFIICFVLFIVWIGFKLILDLVLRLKITAPDLPIILLFMVFFLLIIIYSNHFIPLYFGIEGTALSTCVGLVLVFDSKISLLQIRYSFTQIVSQPSVITEKLAVKYSQLIANWKLQKTLNQEAVAAGMLYFLLNLFVTISLGYLFFFLLLNFNTLSFFSLLSLFLSVSDATFEIGLIIIFFLMIFCFKLGITPFHFWLPGVFSGANYGILFFLALPVKIVFSFLLFKLFFTLFSQFFFIWGPLFLFLGLLSIFVGSIGLYYENQIKRFFAYSTINHFGNMFLAFGMGNFMSQNAFLIYFFTYILMNVMFINYVSSLTNTVTNKTIFSFSEINNIQFTSTISQIGFAFTLLSMIGLPPFVGFWGKMVVLKALLFTPTLFGFFLVLLLIGTSVLAASSYLGVIKTLFINSYKNSHLSRLFPFSFFSIKNGFFFVFLISFGFTIQFCPFFIRFFDLFIISMLFTDYIPLY